MADPRSGRRYQEFRHALKAEHAITQRPCSLCGLPIDYRLRWPHPGSWSLEHKVAITHGGSTFDLSNCTGAHLRCNQSKGARLGNAKRRARKPRLDPPPPPGWGQQQPTSTRW